MRGYRIQEISRFIDILELDVDYGVYVKPEGIISIALNGGMISFRRCTDGELCLTHDSQDGEYVDPIFRAYKAAMAAPETVELWTREEGERIHFAGEQPLKYCEVTEAAVHSDEWVEVRFFSDSNDGYHALLPPGAPCMEEAPYD